MLFKSYKDWRQYLRDSGYVNGAINEREYHFLLDQGVSAGQLNEMWFEFLRDLGYSGSISSMAKSWENEDFLTASFSVSITNLDGSIARIGSHASIGYTITPDNGTETVKWSNSATPGDAATYGTGATPDPFDAGDGGTLYLHVTDGGETVTASAPIQQVAPTVNAAASTAGILDEGETLTGTPATFNGNSVTITNLWEVSTDNITFTSTGNTTTTSPALVLGSYYRFVSTGTNSGGAAVSTTAADGPILEAFEVTLETDGTLQINNNDGRDFTVDDALDRYDGTYSVTEPITQPVALVAPVLVDDGTPAVGETLTIIPALWAYDPDYGALVIDYPTNGTNAVDVTDPDNPTLLVDAADAGVSIIVTSEATQGANAPISASNSIAIPASGPTEVFRSAVNYTGAPSTSLTFTTNLSSALTGDTLVITVGPFGLATACEIETVPASGGKITTDPGDANARSSIAAFEHVMTVDGGATDDIVINAPVAADNWWMDVVCVRNGSVIDVGAESDPQGNDNTVNLTPTTTANLIYAVAIGESTAFDDALDIAWTGVTQDSLDPAVGAFGLSGSSQASAVGVTAAAFDVTCNAGGAGDRSGMVAFVIE